MGCAMAIGRRSGLPSSTDFHPDGMCITKLPTRVRACVLHQSTSTSPATRIAASSGTAVTATALHAPPHHTFSAGAHPWTLVACLQVLCASAHTHVHARTCGCVCVCVSGAVTWPGARSVSKLHACPDASDVSVQ